MVRQKLGKKNLLRAKLNAGRGSAVEEAGCHGLSECHAGRQCGNMHS